MVELIQVALEITNKIMGLIDEKNRTKYLDRYHSILKEMDEISNRPYDEWSDSDLDAIYIKSMRFLQAFSSELPKSDLADLRSGTGWGDQGA